MRIGIDLGGTKTELAVLDQANKVLWRQRRPSAYLNEKLDENQRLDAAYQQTISIISELLHAAEADIAGLHGVPVGIGTPGSENIHGLMRNCNSIWLNGRPFKLDLERALGRSVRLANDANCFALAEQRMGAAQGVSCVFGIILGTGVGGGVVINGTLLNGVNGVAGEWGHNPVPIDLSQIKTSHQRKCYCGRFNCLETWLSGSGLSQSYQQLSGQHCSTLKIIEQVKQGDQLACEALQQYYQLLAACLGQIINVLDPDIIVVGGGLSNIQNLYIQVPSIWHKGVFSDEPVKTSLKQADLGDSAGVYGAAWLW